MMGADVFFDYENSSKILNKLTTAVILSVLSFSCTAF